MYTNADVFDNKLDELKERIIEQKPDIVLINEVRPKKKTPRTLADYHMELSDAYEPLHNNIENDVGRGQLVLVKKTLKSKEVHMNSKFSEGMYIEIKLKGKDRLIVVLIYRSESDGEAMSGELTSLISEINSKGYSHILMID